MRGGVGDANDGFVQSGFAQLTVPNALLARYNLGSYTCLEDLLLGRVEAVVTITDDSGATVGYWLVRQRDDKQVGSLPHDPRVVLEPTDWSEYLARLSETDVAIVDRDPVVLGARPSGVQKDLVAIANDTNGPTTSLWTALLAAKSERP